MDSPALYRTRLTLINLIAMFTALGLAGIGKSLYLSTKISAAMATGFICLLLGGTFLLLFPLVVKQIAQGESDWWKQEHNHRSLWLNAGVCAGTPLIVVFLASDGPQLLGASAAPLYFRLPLGLAMFTTLLCSALIAQHFARLIRALQG